MRANYKNMKKSILIALAFLFVLFCNTAKAADAPFEGTVLVKTFTSFSKHYHTMYPHFYEGVDTCEITIKGDMIHEYFRCNQTHKIFRGGRITYYSDLTKTGFDIPFPGIVTKRTVYNTNEKRTYAGMECSVVKTTILQPTNSIEVTGWVTDNIYNISPDALQTVLSSFTCNLNHHYDGKMCLKSTVSSSMLAMAKAMVGSLDQFLSFEVIDIEQHEVENNKFDTPSSIKIKNLTQSSLSISVIESTFDAVTPKELIDAGFTKQMMVDLFIYITNEQDLLAKHKKKLKRQQKEAKNQEIVTFDIDEEWNY